MKLALAVVFSVAIGVQAQPVRDRMLVSTEWLQRHLGSVTVLHIGDRAGYDAGHIPGALLVETSSLLVQRDDTPNELPPVAALERVFRAAGVDSRSRIVVYSNDPLFAARAWFTLDYLGQGSRVSLLDGGYAKWRGEGCAISQAATKVKPGTFEARVMPQALMRIGPMRELVRLHDQIAPGLAFFDARSSEQFGEGRIPGSTNLPFEMNFAADGRYRSAHELRSLYAGASSVLVNVVYCRTGMQASVTYFVLRYLGYDTALYDGSYVEWSNAGEAIET